ncbi:C40 family peptidase [Stenotrophomonas sp. 24(2023)]|uniref:C40 family peptidase n=1 Tax=Stenotrophomonas sp. 24(2023) TaxID=3068324 RepID=UPI0027DED742|nr:C40 family peptidase [Stenotrophomonas sp. 24(2023)]WMJ70005.1 NlpC/P60 family protein [Stenotrophomonas sp. 24(2023)]
MTTDDLTCEGQTAAPARSARPLLLGVALLLTSLPAWSQTAPRPADAPVAPVAEVPATPAAAKPAAKVEAPQRSRADAAASATLAALLPHLASNDSIPLMDRSAMVAGDLSRLLANYDTSSAATGAVVGDAADNGKVQSLLRRAMTLLGTPYRWGGTNPDNGFDCSGLVSYVFRTALGIELPRVSREMAHDGNAELINDRNALAAGDLVFFGRKGRVDHVGIYVGEGRFLHAPSSGKDVRVDTLLSGYWGNKFMQARRVEL